MIQTLKKIVKKSIYWGHKTTSILDSQFLKKEIKCQWPPIFILGAPRSGTTLIYQLLISNFRFAYFPNIANTFYMCPIYATINRALVNAKPKLCKIANTLGLPR